MDTYHFRLDFPRASADIVTASIAERASATSAVDGPRYPIDDAPVSPATGCRGRPPDGSRSPSESLSGRYSRTCAMRRGRPLTLSLSPFGGEGIEPAPSPSERERVGVRVALCSRIARVSGMLENFRTAQKGPDARRRPSAAREAYFLCVERAAEGAALPQMGLRQPAGGLSEKTPRRWDRGSSAGFAGATIPGGRLRKGAEAPLRVP